MAAQVRDDHAVSAGEVPDHGLEHLAGDHQPMHEQEGRSGAVLGEEGKI
jgi:hypothetical protein